MTPKVKICGLKTADTLDAALRCGADYLGFIFFEKSPRNIAPELAGELAKTAAERAQTVAVTVNAEDEVLDRIVEVMRPDMLQLHGREPPDRVTLLKQRFGLPVIKAFAVRDRNDLASANAYRGIADQFLFDAKPPRGSELPGGNGVSFDWQLLRTLDRDMKYMLSGGLNAANIGDALLQVEPPAIDVSTGVERAPGVKDIALIEQFFQAIGNAVRQPDSLTEHDVKRV